ncbi:bis(5'-nucleosyl)-tetraphosphatase (symmetrical) YqeK [Sporosarcina sp. 179-K 3D1 HS]|uniref:bis(5'-nucleosyl)-tetraphosphatase (symmetrical) YqeK n=1 Tax=Sporosarcina sp. 179-K 3D1 HS TaxID=3232169 RepID=UPI0039A2069A
MDLERIKREVATRLSNDRYEHVLRVVSIAKILGERFGLPLEQVEAAALLHDVAKCMEKGQLQAILEEEEVDPRLFSFHPELWHAPAGTVLARDEYGIRDEDILNAIRYHTTGRAQMSPLEKLIYVADMIEMGRNFPGVDDLREAAKGSLDVAMSACIIHSIRFLANKGVPIFPDSIDCYNEHIHMRGMR